MDSIVVPSFGPTFDHIIALLGSIVPLLSLLAGFFNGRIRNAQTTGEDVSPTALKAVAALNVLAVNFDKAAQLMQIVKTGTAPTTTPRPGLNGAPEDKQE